MTRITHLDLPSIQRHFVGFDSMFNEMDRMFENSANKGSGYPPYNIAQISEDEFMISVAVAGFSMDNLEITKDKNILPGILGTVDHKIPSETSTFKAFE